MEVRVEKRGSVAVVSIDGSVDGTSAPALVSSLRQQVTAGTVQLVADLAGTDYTSLHGSLPEPSPGIHRAGVRRG